MGCRIAAIMQGESIGGGRSGNDRWNHVSKIFCKGALTYAYVKVGYLDQIRKLSENGDV